MPVKSTTKEFVAGARMVHDADQYGYDKVVYVRSKIKVVITCLKHGDFEQTPNSHMQGRGCPKCGGIEKSTMEEFVVKSKVVHGADRYSYDKVVYASAHTKVVITCLKHGDFEQTPNNHIHGKGCPKCGGIEKSTMEEFVAKAKVVHGSDRYSYDKVVYVSNKTKVIITCKKHGDFEQTPNHHTRGVGCPKCNSSKGEDIIRTLLTEQRYQYKEQARFQSCKNINPLPFDFSVNAPDQRLIEFHGKQHYEPYSFRGNRKDTQEQMEANLARIQLHDAIKAKWCEDNNVPLLVIPYWDKHRIPELLEEFLCSASLVGAV